VNVDNLSIFYVFCCLHKIRFFTDINKYYYIIYVLLSCDSSNDKTIDILETTNVYGNKNNRLLE
jgi:hypothetical protein